MQEVNGLFTPVCDLADLLGWRPMHHPQNIVISAANAHYCAMNQGLQKVLRLSKTRTALRSLQSAI